MRITPAALTNSGAIKRQKEYCWPLIWVSSREPEYFYILSHFISCFIHIIIPTCCKNSVLFFGHETDGQVTSLDVLCLWWKTGLNSTRKMFDRFSVFTKKRKKNEGLLIMNIYLLGLLENVAWGSRQNQWQAITASKAYLQDIFIHFSWKQN